MRIRTGDNTSWPEGPRYRPARRARRRWSGAWVAALRVGTGWPTSVLWRGRRCVAGHVAGHFGDDGGIDTGIEQALLLPLPQDLLLLLFQVLGLVAPLGGALKVGRADEIFLLTVQLLNPGVEVPQHAGNLGGHRSSPCSASCRCSINEHKCLPRQNAGQLLRRLGCRRDRLVGDADTVVRLVPVTNPAKNFERFLDRGGAKDDRSD